ncbi:hypothetical protein SAMD00019534_060080 [Acytostelium subglobosum LB1]|uniref:hypothetical protein n=1 Tax=Acytostelium subglobosum LB1 TaxID=1410327 RepID=UPI000644B3B2|nr:hypothetical protein SAMD00019534_060080 [Acytostelium subglobosum LB1]GAM22833.1 hypothetical protein SAMD00019534_060080 [Acytostelium subglobosum LB1]|eukprot:XP_012754060.1 hypothetical protein SAMD00019534_060080 [Acytostelium subglobosum LB1]
MINNEYEVSVTLAAGAMSGIKLNDTQTPIAPPLPPPIVAYPNPFTMKKKYPYTPFVDGPSRQTSSSLRTEPPAPVDLSCTIRNVVTTELYNILQDHGINKIVIDLRPTSLFNQSRIHGTVNIPPPPADLADYVESITSQQQQYFTSSNKTFNMTKYSNSCYGWAGLRHWCLTTNSVILLSDGPFSTELDMASVHKHYDDDWHTFDPSDTTPGTWERFVMHYLVSRRKSNVEICNYSAGFSAYHTKYPFLCAKADDERCPPNYPSEILDDFLYLGAYDHASDLKQLKNLNITYIVNMAVELENCYHMYKYYRADLEDNFKADITSHFTSVIEFINEAKRNNTRVLVHCAMGISRSTTAVLAYLMKEHAYRYIDARRYVKQRRSIIQPNFSFGKALTEYDKVLYGAPPATVAVSETTTE